MYLYMNLYIQIYYISMLVYIHSKMEQSPQHCQAVGRNKKKLLGRYPSEPSRSGSSRTEASPSRAETSQARPGRAKLGAGKVR